MSADENSYPLTVDEAVKSLLTNMSLNDEILLASLSEENLIDPIFVIHSDDPVEYFGMVLTIILALEITGPYTYQPA